MSARLPKRFLPYEVIDVLRALGAASAAEIALQLSVTDSSVRAHLRRAKAWRLVAVLTHRRPPSGVRGRGVPVYGLHESLTEPVQRPTRRAA